MGKINATNAPRQASFEEQPELEAKQTTPSSPLKELTSKRKQGASKHTFSMSQLEWEFLQELSKKLNDQDDILLGNLEKTSTSELVRWGISYLIEQQDQLNIEALVKWRKKKYDSLDKASSLLSTWKK